MLHVRSAPRVSQAIFDWRTERTRREERNGNLQCFSEEATWRPGSESCHPTPYQFAERVVAGASSTAAMLKLYCSCLLVAALYAHT